MTVCAVIAEYNPLHRGHLVHLSQIKARLGQDARLVAVMSGHTVQRGDFPILTKTARTRMALEAGFDLVFELPAPYACAPAERFARAAVDIIARLGVVTHLSFGTETDDLEALQLLSKRIPDEIPRHKTLAAALPEAFPDAAHLFTPNNILALEYLRALRGKAPGIVPVAVERRGGFHDGPRGSASAIRGRALQTGRVPRGVPFAGIWQAETRAGRAPVSLARQEGAVLSHLRRLTLADFLALPDVGAGGLAQRLHNAAGQARSLEELLQAVKTKRYTMARLRRCVLAAFLGLTEEMAERPPHIRLLGIGPAGEAVLSLIETPILSRPAAHRGALAAEAAVTDQMALCMPVPEPAGGEWRNGVVVKK
ncbi:MAG: nucleotidyltransferase family protein [Oscillospiraceae bacterium]|jgi:predicted nucleotidyltransferase|nr:nucleotidyltransferase family protein [Oscillospiraceae bacterium]